MNQSLLIAIATLCIAIVIVQSILLLRERKAHKAFRVQIKRDMNRMETDHQALRRLSQILNFRHGGVASVLVSLRRIERHLNPVSEVDIKDDQKRVDRFLSDLVDDGLTHLSETQRYQLNGSMTPQPTSQRSKTR